MSCGASGAANSQHGVDGVVRLDGEELWLRRLVGRIDGLYAVGVTTDLGIAGTAVADGRSEHIALGEIRSTPITRWGGF